MIAFVLAQPSNPDYLQLKLKTPEQLLVTSILNNEQGSFNQLYKMYAPNLFGVIVNIVKQNEAAEDILQEVFLKIKTHLPLFDDKKARLFTWMLNITRNTSFDYLRRKSNKQTKLNVDLTHHHLELESYSHAINTDVIGIKKLMNRLTKKQNTVLDLAYYQGYTHTEIADYLDMPIGSVKTVIRQAILRLRGVFGNP